MCTTCGCGLAPPRPPLHGAERGASEPPIIPVDLHEKILAGNDRAARHNREHFLASGVLALNLMGSPGSGKTAVLEATARGAAARGWRLGAVSADLATDNDARRLEKAGIPARAITTGQACHLDADLVHRSLHDFPWRDTDVFFIENVGNLVCPAIYDLGQAANVVVLSVTEGEDKPLKYPVMFRAADLVLLTKCDLVPHLDVDLAEVHGAIARVMPRPRVIEVSARTGSGMDAWIGWLEELRASLATPGAPRAHGRVDAQGDGRVQEHVHGHVHEHEHAGTRHAHPHGHHRDHPQEGGGDHRPAGAGLPHDGSDHDHEH
jgi:hydrogenase nickel incorporation protein HypB